MNEFYKLEKKVADIYLKVNLYQELYANKDSVKALNSNFKECFSIFQQTMFFEIVCRVCALFDPAGTRNSKNLTLDLLVGKSGDAYSKEAHINLESIKYDFKRTGLKEIRNKLLAHNDYDALMKEKKFATDISYKSLTKLLSEIQSFIKDLGLKSGHIPLNQSILYDKTISRTRNGKALIKKVSGA